MHVILKGTDIDNHHDFWVFAHVVLEEWGQFWVAVGDVRALCCNGIDHVTQMAQALVDCNAFLLALALHSWVIDAFGSCKVDQHQVSVERMIFIAVIYTGPTDTQLVNAVASWRVFIESCGTHRPISYGSLQQMLHVIKTANFYFNWGPFWKFGWFTLLHLWTEQISHGLYIDFIAAQWHFKLWLFRQGELLLLRKRFKDHLDCSRHNASLAAVRLMITFHAMHRESFTRSSLSISKDAYVVAI